MCAIQATVDFFLNSIHCCPVDLINVENQMHRKRNCLIRIEIFRTSLYFSWFHGMITREEANRRLEREVEGTYLVRNSESVPNNYSLSLR